MQSVTLNRILESCMKPFFLTRAPLAVVLMAAATIAGCKDKNTTGPSGGTPATITATNSPSGTPQVATAIQGPSVTVTDAGGTPVSGVLVNFAVTAGGGAVQFPQATTDAGGVASAGFWQIGPIVGVNTTSATAEGVASPVSFSVTSSPGPASKMAVFSGDAQQGAPGSTLPNPLSVRVVDAGGNPKPGIAVTFAVTSGGGSLSSTAATTDANGVATSGSWTLGNGQCGQNVSATAGTLSTGFTGSSRGSIAVGGTATGTLAAGDCTFNGKFADEYNLTTANEAVNISLSSAAFNAFLEVVNAAGSALVLQNDDSPAGGTTNSLARLIAGAGSKAVRATSAAAGETGDYSVSVTSTSSAVTDCSTVYIEVGASTDQNLSPSDCNTNYANVAGDAFKVWIQAGTTVRISQTAIPLDALIAFLSPTGALIVERDNGGVGASGTEIINYTASTSGFYTIVATSYCLVYDDPYQANCDYGPYTLSVINP
jgi:hypothetical protein